MAHIIDRFIIHFAASTFGVLALFFALRFLFRKRPSRWFSSERLHLLVTSALIVAASASLREPFDVAHGQSLVKALSDFISWYGGCTAAVWGLYRFTQSVD